MKNRGLLPVKYQYPDPVCKLWQAPYRDSLLGVCRIVIFAESEYSAEYTLPNPNILPNIRHCRIMKKICLIKRVFNADVHSRE